MGWGRVGVSYISGQNAGGRELVHLFVEVLQRLFWVVLVRVLDLS